MIRRIITAISIIAIVLPPLLIGGKLLTCLIFSICMIAAFEMVTLRNKKGDFFLLFVVFAYNVLTYCLPLYYYTPILCFYVFFLFLIAIVNENFNVEDSCFILAISIMLSVACKGFVEIYETGFAQVMYLLIACFTTDTFAYFTGYYLGKTPFCKRISPNKTLEGAIGGYISGFFASFIFAYFFVEMAWHRVLIVSLTLPAIAQVGDLAFSAIKRYYNVKDFGNIFPGHGGILDRIDSLVFCTICLYALFLFFFPVII